MFVIIRSNFGAAVRPTKAALLLPLPTYYYYYYNTITKMEIFRRGIG